jgi:hypothetical protein
MKHLKKIRGFLLLLPLLGLGGLNSCSILETPEPQLPAETQEGKNTFGCLVNGKVWIPYFGGTDIYNTQATKATFDPFNEGQFSIRASQKNDYNNKLHLLIIGTPINGKTYNFNKTANFQIGDIIMGVSSYNNCSYVSPDLTYFTGKSQIKKFDLQSRVIAGTFECTLKTSSCDTIKITQGRFDMTF